MTQIHKKLVAIMLSVIMALTVFPCLGMSFAQTAFADDEITAEEVTGDDGAAAVEEEPVVEEEPAVEEEAVQKEKRVQKNDSEIYIEPFADRSVLYSDGNSKFYVYGWSDEDYNFQYQVGLGYRDDYGDWHWDKVFTAGSGLYTYNEDSEVLTLYGSAIHSEVNAYNQSHGSQYNEVFIRATFSDRYGNVYQDSSLGVDLAEPCYDFNGWLNDRMLLLDESDYVKKTFWAEVWNAKYPDGEDVKCTVSKLTSSDSAVVKLTEKEKRWNYKGVGEGIATLTATVKIGKMDPMEVPFKVEVGMDSVGGEIVLLGSEDGLPGESLPVRADAWHDAYDYDYDDCENEVFGYEWFIDENDTDYATVKADSEDPSYATVTFKNRTDKDLERDVTVCCRISYLGNNGKTVSTVCSEYVTVHTDYYEISPQDLDTLDIDQSVTIKPELQFCTVNSAGEPVRQPQSATIKWTYDKKIINREDLGGGKYKLTRIKPGEVEIELYCDYNGEEYGAYYFMEEIATNLSYYELEFVGAAEYGDTYYIDDSNEGITPEIHVIDPETDYIVPESEYDLIVQKIVYTKNGGEKYEDSSFPLKFNYDPAKRDEDGNGYCSYLIRAKAKDSSKWFTKATSKWEGGVSIYSKNTLTYGAGVVSLDKKYRKWTDYVPYVRYDVPVNSGLSTNDFIVKAEGGKTLLNPATDFTVTYHDIFTGEVLNEFPNRAGGFICCTTGAGDYYSRADDIELFIGDANPMTAKAKTATVKFKKLKKKAQTVKAITVKNQVGKVTYTGYWGGKIFKVNKKTGKIKVKKGTKKGTYYFQVVVRAAGDNQTIAPGAKALEIKIKVK
ncbi:MAG: hypothetical protein IJI74_06390 [Firmicutes bacterium]|nr:hypothetical protein [Bacillota bacterium]